MIIVYFIGQYGLWIFFLGFEQALNADHLFMKIMPIMNAWTNKFFLSIALTKCVATGFGKK